MQHVQPVKNSWKTRGKPRAAARARHDKNNNQGPAKVAMIWLISNCGVFCYQTGSFQEFFNTGLEMRSTKFVYAKYVIFPQLLAKALPRRETNNARLCGAPHTLKKVRRCVEIPMQKKEFRPLPSPSPIAPRKNCDVACDGCGE